jgi:beta-glucosidase
LKSPENVIYKQGANFTEISQDFNDTISSAQSVDVVILCIGEDTYTETPGNIDNLMISDPQMQLATKLLDTGIPVIVVFIGGRPRTITPIVKKAKAVLLGFLPGNRGGDAIADIIFGDYNPNGKLPITYPKGPNGAMNYDFKPLEDYEVNNGENVASYFDAIFPFGFGLSYTQFEYSNLQINQKKITEPSGVTGSVTVKNIGDHAGKETVIVYLNDEVGSLSRPVKQMKFFKKVNLNLGDSETVNFELTRNDMSFINLKNQRIVESGNFNIYVGNLTVSFELIAKPNEYPNNGGDNISVGKKFLIYLIAIIIGFFH